MEIVILVLVVIGALFAIASGVWVAIALINAITGPRAISSAPPQANEKDPARLGSRLGGASRSQAGKPSQAGRETKSSD